MMNKDGSKSAFMENIRSKGALAEKLACVDLIQNGYNVEKISRGADFIISKPTSENNSSSEFIEVKLNGSKLSQLQKQTKQKMKRKGITYSVYRVSDAYLDNAEKELSSETKSPNKLFCIINNTMQHGTKYKIAVPSTCPHCGRTVHTLDEVVEEFGLRVMSDGTIRDQSWCKDCRWGTS